MMVKKTKLPTPLQVKLSLADRETLNKIREARGLVAVSETVRVLIREAAVREGVSA